MTPTKETEARFIDDTPARTSEWAYVKAPLSQGKISPNLALALIRINHETFGAKAERVLGLKAR